MKPWYRVFLYLVCLPWDLVTWPMILLIRLFWGENLRWEREPTQGSPALTCDLKPYSWAARTWYARKYKINGKKTKVENHPDVQDVYGKYRTWGGTTLGPHAIFYGPGRRVEGKWWAVQQHEHRHVEQGEAAMMQGFMFGLPVFISAMIMSTWLWIMALVMWTLGYVSMTANFFVALLRGEEAYRGSHHEEAAYDNDDLWEIREGK